MTRRVLTLPFKRPPMTANDQRRAHWTQVRQAKTTVENAVQTLAKKQNLKQVGPCVIAVKWFTPDKRKRDVDSLGPILKAILDGLVKSGVLLDDNSDHVVETRMSINKTQTENARIEVEIIEQ